jgi:hypothetical protein
METVQAETAKVSARVEDPPARRQPVVSVEVVDARGSQCSLAGSIDECRDVVGQTLLALGEAEEIINADREVAG